MIKSADVFMPCTKAKNKLTVTAQEEALDLMKQLGKPVGQTIQDILMGTPESQSMLPNFTSQIDFACNTLAQQIYRENHALSKKKVYLQPKSMVLNVTQQQRAVI